MTTTSEAPGTAVPPRGGSVATTPVNPAPLAFGAFAGTTFLLSWVNAGLVNPAGIEAAVATAWVFGGVVQILVACWHLRDDELFPAVAFGSFGAFWVSFGLFATLYVDDVPTAEHGHVTALFLAPWAVFSLYMLVGALRTNVGVAIAFVLVECTLLPLIVGNAAGNEGLVRLGGWFGILLSAEVWYVAAAELLNHQFGRTILPLKPLGR